MVRNCNNPECLTGKEKIAADHYVAHGNKSDAYRAGYATAKMKALTVNRRAVEIFARPHVKAYVETLQAQAQTAAILTRQRALEILTDIAEGRISEFIQENGEIDTAAVSRSGHTIESFRQAVTEGGTTRSIKVRDPITAIDRIAKLEGWDKQQDDGDKGVNFTFIIDGEQRSFDAQL
ncbi:MAG: terminase small subunit [Kiritimatiellae bacterium]|jgi:phage terminase small subunit|nr:terminase small subunit [Kiritimatiellia bacterium]